MKLWKLSEKERELNRQRVSGGNGEREKDGDGVREEERERAPRWKQRTLACLTQPYYHKLHFSP